MSERPRGQLQNTSNSELLATMRTKLDAAIVAEAWAAVTAIAARIRELERVGVVDFVAERAKRERER